MNVDTGYMQKLHVVASCLYAVLFPLVVLRAGEMLIVA